MPNVIHLLLHGIAALVVPSVAFAHLCRSVLEAECSQQNAAQLNVISVSVYDLIHHHVVVIYFCMLYVKQYQAVEQIETGQK